MRRMLFGVGALAGLLVLPVTASAQVFFTPFAGVTFGGDAAVHKLSMGGSLTFMGKAAGLEIEFGYTPDFFGEQRGVALISSSNVTTLTANIVVGPGVGPIRPYVVGGIGLLRPRVETSGLFSDVTANDLGLDAGGGLLILVSPHVGLRGDLRYFRRLRSPSGSNDLDVTLSDFRFWRVTGGLSFRF